MTVKAGYGRNYLIPQGLAYVASEANMARLEEEQARATERMRRDFLEARRRASQLEGASLTFSERASEDGKLFGSVTAADIAEQLNAGGLDFQVEKRAVQLEEPIKEVGEHTVQVKLHPEVVVDVPVLVESAEGQGSIKLPSEVARAVELALERKAHDVTVLDLRGISSATDYFVVASGNSDVQVKAIADHVLEELKKEGSRAEHVEGQRGGRWVLLDYIDFVVHVFHPQARTFYQLENLWGDAPRWEAPEA